MIDAITYCPDLGTLADELQVKLPEWVHIDDSTGVIFNITKTPIIKNAAGESLALIRVPDADFLRVIDSLDSLQVLASARAGVSPDPFDLVLAEPSLTEIYNRVYDRTPQQFTVEGESYSYTPPTRFGTFG